MTPSLRELQQAFVAGVYEDDPRILDWVADARLGAARHWQVYPNNTHQLLTEALAAVYPATRRLVGEGFFAFAAHRFIRRHPPRVPQLLPFGREFADFLAGFEPAADHPYLPDVARLEWAWHEVWHEADAEPLSVSHLTALDLEAAPAWRFRLHPALRLLQSPAPVLRLWRTNLDDAAEESPVSLAESGDALLVLRSQLVVEVEKISEADLALLRACAMDAPLDEAYAVALGLDPHYPLSMRLGHFLARGVFVAIDSSPITHPGESPA